MTQDRLQELASSSVQLTEVLGWLRGSGLPDGVGPDPLVHADASDAIVDEFLSLAVREAGDATDARPHHVFLGLALSLPDCVVERGVGEEALEYCLASKNLSRDDVGFIFRNMSRPPGPHESLCAAHRRISGVAIRAGHARFYYEFLMDNINELVDECPADLADFMLDPRFPVDLNGLHCLILAIEHSGSFERYAQRWIDWILEGRFDSFGPGHVEPGALYNSLQERRDNPRFGAVRAAAHIHFVHLLQSPEKVDQAGHHLRGLLIERYAASDELVTAITRSGLRKDQLESDVLRLHLDALWQLSRDPSGSPDFEALRRVALKLPGGR